MFEQITTYLRQKSWHYTENQEIGSIQFNLSGVNGTFRCTALIEEDIKRLGFYSYCPAYCPSDAMIKMTELLMRLNGTVFYGSFELNFETGVILYKTSLFCNDVELTSTVLDNIVIRNVAVMDDCTPIILRLMYGNLSPAEIIQARFGQRPQLEG